MVNRLQANRRKLVKEKISKIPRKIVRGRAVKWSKIAKPQKFKGIF